MTFSKALIARLTTTTAVLCTATNRPLLVAGLHRSSPSYAAPNPTKPKSKPATPLHPFPNPRHEAHEQNLSINVPFNPPGAGAGTGPPGPGSTPRIAGSALLDAALATIIGLSLVFVGGVAYVSWYKKNVLDKIEAAFQAGYDPALELAKAYTLYQSSEPIFTGDEPWTNDVRRKEQDFIDRIVHGEESGHYFMFLGPKGTGKGTMMFDSMTSCQAEGVSMCDAHPDLEIFRLRLGKALNYEFNEDTQTGLFQRRDPKEGGAGLDIERALDKLEKVALRMARRTQRPLVLIINNIHFFNNDEAGRNVLLQLQQKAESWAASGILTLVFSSDDFWPFHVLRKSASRMHVLSIYDLTRQEALQAAANMRKSTGRKPDTAEIREAVAIVGGRLSYLNKVTKSSDMISMSKHLLAGEKAWLLSQIGLIPDCDDDVMDEQKWSSCAWLLLQEFVKLRQDQEATREEAIKAGLATLDDDLPLPIIPYWRCRQIMTRADFLEELDRINAISIDIHQNVRPDSLLVLHAAQTVINEAGFDELLDGVRSRIDEIESLHRTRELTFKDLNKGDTVRLVVDKGQPKQRQV